MNEIKIIAGSIAFAIYFIEYGRFPAKWRINFKPFNCAMCLSVWVSLWLLFMPNWFVNGFAIVFITGILSIPFRNLIINTIQKKINNGTTRN